MTSWLKGYVLYAVVCLIALLLLGDIYLIYQNNRVITFNKNQQEQAEKIKVQTSEVIRSLHLLDLAVRSYAFVRNDHFKAAIELAIKDNEAALSQLEIPLTAQKYSMEKFYDLRDSIAAYIQIANFMIGLIEKGDQPSFVKLLEEDPGYKVWLQYQKFSTNINTFENEISSQAKFRY